MFYNIFYEHSQIINIFKYITFRTGAAMLTALFISFLCGPYIIKTLKKKLGKNKTLREEYMTKEHIEGKKDTPIMGGLLILLALFTSTFLWADMKNPYVWIAMFVTLGFGAIGFTDDYQKVVKKNHDGLPGKLRLLIESAISLTAIYFIYKISPENTKTTLQIPFFKNMVFDIGIFYFLFALFVIVGSSNAVNLTDGLDGLTIVPVVTVSSVFIAISYVLGRVDYSNYLFLSHIPNVGEMAVFCGALVGAGLGFLWFNAPPAQIFMGDVGALALGSALGIVAVITKHEIVYAIAGGLFVLETISVIMQVISFKLTGKRIFKMAPLHHHFEKSGWHETTIVVRFWIISIILALFALATLKLR